MGARRSGLGFPALGVAIGGVLAGHGLAYLIARPDHHDRSTLLAGTGHGYLGAAVEAAWLVAVAAAAVVFLSRLAGGGSLPQLGVLTRRLWVLQLGAFATLEVAERAVAGSFEGLLFVCLVGSATQLVVACASAWILRRLLDAADAAAAVLGRGIAHVPAGRTASLLPAQVRLAAAAAPSPFDIRGPPSMG